MFTGKYMEMPMAYFKRFAGGVDDSHKSLRLGSWPE
jgi:hypothetical protein